MTTADWGVISVDDHVTEPPDTFTSRVPVRLRDRAPRIVERGEWGITWLFDGQERLFSGLVCSLDTAPEDWKHEVIHFEDLHPGCYDVEQRLADMDETGVLASMCFPSMPGFGGTHLNANPDRELALACIRAYNDFITEQWCAAAPNRLIPAIIVPYWDAELAAAEVRRTAPRGVRSIVFNERPHVQGWPSLFDPNRFWDPLFRTAEELGIVLSCHIGSSSKVDAPADGDFLTHQSEVYLNSGYSVTEYIFSGTFDRFPELRLVYSEASIGWIPYHLQTMDRYYMAQATWTKSSLKNLPSSYFRKNVFGCFISDPFGAECIDRLGVDAIMCEVDYPHADTIWPNVRKVIDAEFAHLRPVDQYKVRVTNAERVYNFKAGALHTR